MSPTFGSNAAAITGVIFGAIGGAIGGGTAVKLESNHGEKLIKEYDLPDFSQLVFESFAARFKNELPEYSNVNINSVSLTKDFIKQSDSIVILMRFQLLRLANNSGLTAITILEIKDQNKKKIGLKKFTYNTKTMNRAIKMEKFKESNGALIKNEINSAVEKTVDAFVEYLRGNEKK